MYMTVGESKYWCQVSGQGAPVVLLHGFTGSTATWTTLVPTLADRFQVITIDLPGHGKTKVDSAKTMLDCCADIKLIIEQLGLGKVHLLGYSMGGRTALSFAMVYFDMVQSLILESASPGLAADTDREERMNLDHKLANQITTGGIDAFVDHWENIPLFQSQKNLSMSIRQNIRVERLSQQEEGLAMSLTSMGSGVQPSWWDKLETLSLPVLLIVGEWDSKFINLNKDMHYLLPRSDLVTAQKSGHAIHVEQSSFFGKIVSEFILHKQLEGGKQ